MLFSILKPVLIIIEVLIIFNLMIIVHELGHFLAARWRGLVIEKFGIWFGKPLWKKTINGVEYSLGCIPAGGFVALPQLAPMEVMEGKVETPREQLPPISALDKIIVAFAGPLFSFLLALVFAVVVWKVGRPVGEAESTQIIGAVAEKSPAAESGLRPGDKILQIDGHPVTRFHGMGADSITWRVVRSEGDAIAVQVERAGKIETFNPKPRVPEKSNWWNRKNLRWIGIGPKVNAVVGDVQPGHAGAAAGLRKDDIIAAVNGQEIFGAGDIYDHAYTHQSEPLTLTVRRDGQELPIKFEPHGVSVQGVQPNSPALAAGLKKGDLILAIDGKKVGTVRQLIDDISKRAGVATTLTVRRDAAEMPLTVTPLIAEIEGVKEQRAMIGFTPEEGDGIAFLPLGHYRVIHPGPIEQIRLGVMSIINTLDAVLSRKSSISVQHMGGPVMMMNAYYTMLSGPEGIRMALWFSVVLNVNLAMLNLLPIPVLDGGHITLALIEAARRKPVNVRLLEYVQTACALVIIGFMLFIAFFDVQDLPFVGGDKRPQLKFKQPAEAVK
jgi:regulator of sigma E protease